jgi:putative peptidoglycan lipid II flippase
VLNIILNYLFIYQFDFDHRSLALSTSCTITLNFLTLLILLRRKVGGLGLDGTWLLLIKLIAASLGMAWMCSQANLWIEGWMGFDGLLARSIGVFIPIGVGVVVLFGLCKLLKVRELDGLLRSIFRR